jgi:hypothetical protein
MFVPRSRVAQARLPALAHLSRSSFASWTSSWWGAHKRTGLAWWSVTVIPAPASGAISAAASGNVRSAA